MPKHYSIKFWITFWIISGLFLMSWFFFWEFRNNGTKSLNNVIDFLPMDQLKKEELKTVNYFASYLLKKDDQEKTFLILFQNNMELRPGGGYIGTFGILTMKNGKVEKIETHDLSNFDGRIPDTVEPPYPMKETLRVKSWKLRDSNFSPDFETNAKKAEEFYYMGQGEEKFDGVVAINSNVLTSFLKVTGPIEIEGYPGTYDSENAILTLEYQVEKGYAQQGIERGERKSIMRLLSNEIIKKIFTLDNSQKVQLAKIILEDLNQKDIQLYFKNSDLQNQAKNSGWSGNVNQEWNGDYLMIVDANLGAYKSDYYVKRSFEYTVDLSGEVPKANLKINYNHTGKVKDWMTKDYLTYLRVYTPSGSWLSDSKNTSEVRFGEELGKKYSATLFGVPLNQTKTVEFNYNLPEKIAGDYKLLIQKQSGVEDVPGKVTVIEIDGTQKSYDIELKSDWKI